MRRLFLALMVVSCVSASAQKKSKSASASITKKPLTHDVYDGWKEIPYKQLTPDGNYAGLLINPQDGDGKLVIYNFKTSSQDSVPRAADVNLTFDSKYAVFKIKAPMAVVKDLRRQKKKKDELPKDSLGIYTFASSTVEKIPDVKSYKIPEKQGGWIAYQLDIVKEKKDDSKKDSQPDSTKKSEKPKKAKKNSDDDGYSLVLRNTSTGKDVTFGFVKEYAFGKFGDGLVFSSTGNDSTMDAGVYWYDLKDEKLTQLMAGKSKQKFKNLAVSEDGLHVAFIADLDTTKALVRYPKLYHWKKGEPQAMLIADESAGLLEKDWTISEYYTPAFAKDGSKLFFGTAPIPAVKDTTLLPEEIVNVEVWTGDDDYIYPQQNRQLENERKRSYLSVIDLANKKVVSLGDEEIPSIDLGDEGNASVALGETNVQYRKMITWDVRALSDIYLINIDDGSRKLISKEIKASASLSPKAQFVFWFNLQDTAWFSYSVKQNKIQKLAEDIPVSFADEEDDHPDFPSPYGYVGWTANDNLLLVYDRYDIWALDPENRKPAVNLTKIGRQNKIEFRYVRLNPDERFIDPNKEMLLEAFDEASKQSGYYKLSLKDGKLTKLIMGDYRYGRVEKALNADRLLFTRETFREYPDVWTTNFSFSSPKKITDANPQMKNYLWGSVERVNWVSLDGVPLEGLLYKPENFDPKQKYPMMVYFYETYSDNLYYHYAPAPIRSVINFTMYTSNGYLVFVPDIKYKIGYPGESAHNCILPGVTHLIEQGFVDADHIGVQGHSWGGYQSAYLVTRTNIFAAAEAGAPVSNMTSAYGGVRWESGLSRMFQYEHTQSRIGGTLWDKTLRYIENSPLFFADKIETPVLMMHNDDDGAVPWYQGIEFYMALRRLNKPVWLLNYNGEKHGLTQRQNRTDFAIRMMQYFDYYLKGAPEPAWMKTGVPAIEKGINQKLTSN